MRATTPQAIIRAFAVFLEMFTFERVKAPAIPKRIATVSIVIIVWLVIYEV